MRRFLLLAHRVPPGGAFTLNDLAGGGGRMDEVARSISTAFTLSNDLRRDTELTVLVPGGGAVGPRRVRVLGSRLRYLNPDERSTAALVKNALVRAIAAPHEIESSPGLLVGPADPVAELRTFAAASQAFWLTEEGVPLAQAAWPPEGFTAILGDPYGPDEGELRLLRELGTAPVRLGPRSMRTSQCIDVLHREADLRGASTPDA